MHAVTTGNLFIVGDKKAEEVQCRATCFHIQFSCPLTSLPAISYMNGKRGQNNIFLPIITETFLVQLIRIPVFYFSRFLYLLEDSGKIFCFLMYAPRSVSEPSVQTSFKVQLIKHLVTDARLPALIQHEIGINEMSFCLQFDRPKLFVFRWVKLSSYNMRQ